VRQRVFVRPAERIGSWLHLSAAEVPCKTAPFASFSGRTEKGGPARPERVPILLPLSGQSKKASVTQKFYEIVLVHFDETLSLFRQAEAFLKGGEFFSMRVEFHYCPIIGTLHGAGTEGSLAFFGTSVYTWNRIEHLFYQI